MHFAPKTQLGAPRAHGIERECVALIERSLSFSDNIEEGRVGCCNAEWDNQRKSEIELSMLYTLLARITVLVN